MIRHILATAISSTLVACAAYAEHSESDRHAAVSGTIKIDQPVSIEVRSKSGKTVTVINSGDCQNGVGHDQSALDSADHVKHSFRRSGATISAEGDITYHDSDQTD